MGDWGAGKDLSKTMFRVRTTVLFKGQWFKVTAVHDGGKAYDLEHDTLGQRHTHTRMPLWMLVDELPNMARYKVGDVVEYRRRRCTVFARRWSRWAQDIQYRVREGNEPIGIAVQEYQLQPWSDEATPQAL